MQVLHATPASLRFLPFTGEVSVRWKALVGCDRQSLLHGLGRVGLELSFGASSYWYSPGKEAPVPWKQCSRGEVWDGWREPLPGEAQVKISW